MLTRLFWSLPYPLKCLVASMQARRWDRQRHGPAYESVISELKEHELWSHQELVDLQMARLRGLLQRAANHVPYYRNLFLEHGLSAVDITSSQDLRAIPLLEKQTLRDSGNSLVDERLSLSGLVRVSTSGTTGTPLSLYSDIEANSARHAFMDARCRAIAGVQRRRDRSVSLCGQLVAEPGRDRPPFWVQNRRWNQLYMSSYHLSPRNLDHYVDALRVFSGRYIEGYPSSVFAVARHILDNGLEPVPFEACITTAERLLDHQRRAISAAFRCRTFDQYGCAEMAIFASECTAGTMHLSPEMSLVEVVDDHGEPVPVGASGHLVCTGLVNQAQPLIRYRLGDTGAVSDEQCPCGSPLPALKRLDGRTDDVIVTPDGRRIGRLDPVFKGLDGIVEAQIVQERADLCVIRVVPATGFDQRTEHRLRQSLGHRLGPGARVEVEQVEVLERTPRGKLRPVISRIRPEERGAPDGQGQPS